MVMVESSEALSCPPSLARKKGRIPGARWLRNPIKARRSGKTKLQADGHRQSRKRACREVDAEAEVDQLGRDSSVSSDSMDGDRGVPAYAGWVYHVGTRRGYPFCSDRFLVIKGLYVTMFKRNPVENPRAKPIRSGIVGTHLMVEEVGRQIFHGRALYVLRIFNHLDHSRQGKFACNTAEEVERWVSAFKHAKEEAEFSSEGIGSGLRVINPNDEFDINGTNTHSRSVTRGIGKLITIGSAKLITIGRGPGSLLKRPSMALPQEPNSDGYYNYREGDTFEQADWRCFCTVNGLRIFEDVTASKAEKGTIMKAVGVIEATPETIFEQIMSLDSALRYQWDTLTGNLELVEQIDGHSDIVYGSFDPKYFKRFHGKRDFLFSRYWRRDQDGSYSITQVSTTHKSRPVKPCFQRINISPGIWEITPLPPRPGSGTPRSLVTQVVEVKSTGWDRWKPSHYSKFHKTIPYILLCRIAGLRELLGASPELITMEAQARERLNKEVKRALETADPVLEVTSSILMKSPRESAVLESHEEFYDAIMADDPDEEEDECDENGLANIHQRAGRKFNGFSCGGVLATRGGRELDWNVPSLELDPNMFYSSLRRTISDQDRNGWSDHGGKGFMVRSQTYNEDSLKISGGEPLLKLLAVDWLRSDQKIDHIALQSSSCVQSAAGRKAPFILVINLQAPAKPNYSLVMYFVADRPIQPGSLLDQFANGDDAFRNSRFKLIPSIVEGYWMVKRAVGTKACLLGKAVTCNYLRKDNFLEIDVDIGSSSVARSVVGLALGYVTSIVVDLAFLIEAKSAHELPEYLLGTVRINRIEAESAVQFDGNAMN